MYIQSTFTVLRGIISCPLSESLVGKILYTTCRYQFTEYRGEYVRPKHGQHILPLNPSRIWGEMIHAQGCIDLGKLWTPSRRIYLGYSFCIYFLAV